MYEKTNSIRMISEGGDIIRIFSVIIILIGFGVFITTIQSEEQDPAERTSRMRDVSALHSRKASAEDFEREFAKVEKQVAEYNEQPIELITKENDTTRKIIEVEATYYTADCKGCIGITKSGVDVRDTIYYEGKRIVAVDPEVIPLGTEVVVRTNNGEEFEATAQDIGSAIKGKRIDILVETKAEANRLGRVEAEVEIINEE